MRTTSGPTSRNEVVPRVTETRVSSLLASVVTGAFDAARIPFVLRDFGVVARESVRRPALFAARCPPFLSQSEEETMA